MLKEIYEQPAVITETLGGRLTEDGAVWLEGVGFDLNRTADRRGERSTAAASTWHARF